MGEMMTFPETIQEFLEQHKIVDTEQVYTNGAELVPIFRVLQWYDAHITPAKPQTNADKIRQMSDEELAEYLAERSTAPSCTGKCHKDYEVYGELRTFCRDCWLDWLKQEVESDG